MVTPFREKLSFLTELGEEKKVETEGNLAAAIVVFSVCMSTLYNGNP